MKNTAAKAGHTWCNTTWRKKNAIWMSVNLYKNTNYYVPVLNTCCYRSGETL